MANLKVFVCALLLLLSAASRAEGLQVITEHFPPYNYEQDGKIVGISTELVEAALRRAKLDYRLRLKPWKRAYDFTKSNPNTLLFSTTKLPLRSEEFKWIGPLYPQQNHAYKLKGRSDIVVNDTQDLKRYTLGLLEYDANHQILASKGLTEDNFRFVVNYEQVLRILLEGRVDLVFHNVYSLKHELQRRPDISMDDLESVYVVPRELQFYIAANKATDDKIITALQASLDALVAEGLRDEIINKYFPGKGRDISF